jgi:sec-independent protein translocase protein TatA
MGNIGMSELLVILVIVMVLFGAKRLRNVGSDLGAAIKGFRESMREGDKDAVEGGDAADKRLEQNAASRVAEAGVVRDSTAKEEAVNPKH